MDKELGRSVVGSVQENLAGEVLEDWILEDSVAGEVLEGSVAETVQENLVAEVKLD